jgi:FkbM family methyltransferase
MSALDDLRQLKDLWRLREQLKKGFENISETLARAINIEHKINDLALNFGIDYNGVGIAERAREMHDDFRGHADQCFGYITYAQAGEDLIIANIFAKLGIDLPSYLDVGAHHPKNISNTALFYKRGSRGVNVEANANLMKAFALLRPDDINVNVGVADRNGTMTLFMHDDLSGRNTLDEATAESFAKEQPAFPIRNKKTVLVMTLNALVDQYCGGKFPDFLTIDVEGLDETILRSTDFSASRPKVICVETETTRSVEGGVRAILEDKYFLYCKTWGNAIFVDREYEPILR